MSRETKLALTIWNRSTVQTRHFPSEPKLLHDLARRRRGPETFTPRKPAVDAPKTFTVCHGFSGHSLAPARRRPACSPLGKRPTVRRSRRAWPCLAPPVRGLTETVVGRLFRSTGIRWWRGSRRRACGRQRTPALAASAKLRAGCQRPVAVVTFPRRRRCRFQARAGIRLRRLPIGSLLKGCGSCLRSGWEC